MKNLLTLCWNVGLNLKSGIGAKAQFPDINHSAAAPREEMGRKRDKPYPSPHHSTSFAKRRRHQPPASLPAEDDDVDKPLPKPAPPLALVVVDLPSHCSVLDLKSRFEIYGSISRIRIDRDCVGYIMYRTKDSADAAMAAALDPSFGFTIDSKKVPFYFSALLK